jgi:acetyl-CoA carboxylase carboxyl transferase subunit alpha
VNEIKFERSINELNRKIKEVKKTSGKSEGLDISKHVEMLEEQTKKLEEEYYHETSRWQKVEISRIEKRPQMLDYVSLIFNNFVELSGDRTFGNDTAIVGGFATFKGIKAMLIGNHKGKGLKERLERNFGMPHPEGYRKAVRLMKISERFGLPLITMVDTPGAYPGVEAEERGQSESIAKSMLTMSSLKTPIVSVIIGEGGSGGALALAVADRLIVMENANFSVVSPEGCASILWKDRKMKKKAAEALKSTAQDNLKLGLIDEVVPEPLGGAHRDHMKAAEAISSALERNLLELMEIEISKLLEMRYDRFRKVGVYLEDNPGKLDE